jgi:hypothetical protein
MSVIIRVGEKCLRKDICPILRNCLAFEETSRNIIRVFVQNSPPVGDILAWVPPDEKHEISPFGCDIRLLMECAES